MINKPCPNCGEVQPARVVRVDDGCVEWQCSDCAGRWTIKDGYPGEAFAFWPFDVQRALSDDVEPLEV
jgi:hypothetical protein